MRFARYMAAVLFLAFAAYGQADNEARSPVTVSFRVRTVWPPREPVILMFKLPIFAAPTHATLPAMPAGYETFVCPGSLHRATHSMPRRQNILSGQVKGLNTNEIKARIRTAGMEYEVRGYKL
jgi:hypothetical protein